MTLTHGRFNILDVFIAGDVDVRGGAGGFGGHPVLGLQLPVYPGEPQGRPGGGQGRHWSLPLNNRTALAVPPCELLLKY